MPTDDDQTDLVPRSHIEALEAKAAKATELESRLAQMERETAFAKALGSTEHPARQYFERGYDGELDVESIRSAAKDAGLMSGSQSPPAEPQGNAPTAAEMAAHARMAASSEGGGGNRPVDLIEGFGPRGSKKPDEILAMSKAAGLRMAEDQQ